MDALRAWKSLLFKNQRWVTVGRMKLLLLHELSKRAVAKNAGKLCFITKGVCKSEDKLCAKIRP